jgi:hypothetical protein
MTRTRTPPEPGADRCATTTDRHSPAARLWPRPSATAATAMAVSLIALVAGAPAAAAKDLALNGTFQATSNGQWSKTRGVYRDQPTVTSTWTITSACTDPYTCAGTVSSDRGWTAPVRKTSTTWILEREIPNWQPCPDGTAATGQQTIRFWRVGDDGLLDLSATSPVFAGEDKTMGPSGACGVSLWLDIAMPFRLVKTG